MSSLPAFSLVHLIRAGGHPRPIYFPAIDGSGASFVMPLGCYPQGWLFLCLWGYGCSWKLLKPQRSSSDEEGGGGVRCPGRGHSGVCAYTVISASAGV